MYTKSYRQGNTREVQGFEVPVCLPDKPELSAFRNFGMPVKDQKFKVDAIPENIESMDRIELDRFVKQQWHKRLNGEWWLIGGREVYVPGTAWFFFNTWEKESGGLPDFRMEAVDYFQVWEHCLRDKSCFGMMIIKCRRLGDTEKTLCAGYELCTRYRNSWFGMQNIVDTDAKENYLRTVNGHNNMPPWFKPSHIGDDTPQKELKLDFPGKSESQRSGFDVNKMSVKPLKSRIDYRPTKWKMYDGRRLRVWHLDEFSKIDPKAMNIIRQWGVIKECLSLYVGKVIVGKGILSSTVEEMNNGETVKICRLLWNQSNPTAKQDNGRTTSGLFRYYRNFTLAAEIDEFGFHKVEEARLIRASQIKAYVAEKAFQDLTDYLRKMPDSIEDALSISAADCIMHPALLDAQLNKIRSYELGDRLEDFIGSQYYDLVWSGEMFKSPVVAIPNPKGRFEISIMPFSPNNRTFDGSRYGPGNVGIHTGGSDPYDHKEGTSDGGLSIFTPWNPVIESENKNLRWGTNEDGLDYILNKGAKLTDRFPLTYRNRPPDPDEYYQDCAKAAVFYGTKILVEGQKPGILNFFIRYGLNQYIAPVPTTLNLTRNGSKNLGLPAHAGAISAWQELLQSHIYNNYETYTHRNLLDDLRSYTGNNRTECDLSVAAGHALLLGYAATLVNEKKKKSNAKWRKIPL